MKANHNNRFNLFFDRSVVLNILKEQNESKSQLSHQDFSFAQVVLNILKEQNESKSQHRH